MASPGNIKRKRQKEPLQKKKPEEEVIDLLDSTDEEDNAPTSVAVAAAAQKARDNSNKTEQQPQTSRDALAALLGQPGPLKPRKAAGTKKAGTAATRKRAKTTATEVATASKASLFSEPSTSRQTGLNKNKAASLALANEDDDDDDDAIDVMGGLDTQLWTEKHDPQTESDLVIHKKKVQEVKDWLLHQRDLLNPYQFAGQGHGRASRVLILTGPPGSGKSTLLRVLYREVGFALTEWQPPVPTLWEEAQYLGSMSGGHMAYESKLESFEEFVLRSKMPALSLTSQSRYNKTSNNMNNSSNRALQGAVPAVVADGAVLESNVGVQSVSASPLVAGTANQHSQQQQQQPLFGGSKPKLVLIDDLPHAAGPDQRKRLALALGDLAATARFPIVVCVTEASNKARQEKGVGAAVGPGGLHPDLIAALEAAQPSNISLNPVTEINIGKALQRVLDLERRSLATEQVSSIAEQAEGDLHNALATLQFVCTGIKPGDPAAFHPKKKARKRTTAATTAKDKQNDSSTGTAVAYAAKDASLSLYHALGKLLYNKRLESQPATHGQCSAWTARKPMENDPEQVLSAAYLEAASITAFLHENITDFVEDRAITDLAGCLAYLSDADVLANSVRYGAAGAHGEVLADDTATPSSTLIEAIAASTAARGVCFANCHPAPRKWQPLKAPVAFAAQRALQANRRQLQSTLIAARYNQEGTSVYAGEVLPAVRSVHSMAHAAGNFPAAGVYAGMLPGRWSRLWNGQVYEQAGGGPDVSKTHIASRQLIGVIGAGNNEHGFSRNAAANNGRDRGAAVGMLHERQEQQQQQMASVFEEEDVIESWDD